MSVAIAALPRREGLQIAPTSGATRFTLAVLETVHVTAPAQRAKVAYVATEAASGS